MQVHEREAELKRFRRDTVFFESHREEFLSRYPEPWVVIFGEQLVAVSPDPDQALAQKRAAGVPEDQGLVEYVMARDDVLILPA